ncbi:hypothetical protein DFH11DRAFT_454076 [Phellopilus nigrolimitatus]|nr:hypothetical protein DFH11DRAFT_454076 [Phellopilus nigrolimitatus]
MSAASSSSSSTQRLSAAHRRRMEVFVEIPPSPFHRRTAPPSVNAPMASTPKPKPKPKPTAGISRANSLKRKLEVFVEIPPSPLHRTTPKATPSAARAPGPSPFKSKFQVYVEIPPSPLHASHKSRAAVPRGRGSLLASKALNANTPAATAGSGSPLKKVKLADGSAKTAKSEETFPNGSFYCHQCRRKTDNSLGLHCTLKSGLRCRQKYCDRCINNRYGKDAEQIRRRRITQQNSKHVDDDAYHWTCPKCADKCNCRNCRKAKGLEPTGKLSNVPGAVKYIPYPAGGSALGVPITKPTEKAIEPVKPKPRAKRPKKVVPEPRWTAVPTDLDQTQAENRFFLREFMLRFAPLMKIGVTHLEELDVFDTLGDSCAKALVLNLLDLIAADAEPEEQKMIKDTLKNIAGTGTRPAALWAHLSALRTTLPHAVFPVPIPDPSPPPPTSESDSEPESVPPPRMSTRISARELAAAAAPSHRSGSEDTLVAASGPPVTHATQLLPPLLALCENALRGASVRVEIEQGCADGREENRVYWAKVREENKRWAEEEAEMGFGAGRDEGNAKKSEKKVKAGPPAKDTEKDKAHRAAREAHKARLSALEHAHTLALQAANPRLAPLGRDARGNVYYAASAHRRTKKRARAPDAEEREGLRKWGWFLAAWGVGGGDAGGEERWWGFADPAEIRQLAKWIAATEELDCKDADVDSNADAARRLAPHAVEMDVDGALDLLAAGRRPARAELKALVKGLGEYAELLAWRIGGVEV